MTEVTIRLVIELSEETRDFIKGAVEDLLMMAHEDYDNDDQDEDVDQT